MERVTRSLSSGVADDTQPTANGPASDDFEPGTIVGDKLKIVRVLGTGGMGTVYEAQHVLTKHDRALKVLHPRFASRKDAVERFLREASAAGRIGNPHIVDTFDAGVFPSGAPFIVMELLRGQSLDELLRERGKLPLAETIALMRQACEGAEAAHSAGIVHRDLKPQNLFVVTRDGEPFLKLLDFGISKFDPETLGEHALTSEGSQLGTPLYMAPEQLRGAKSIGPKADVYALGVILYECISGKRPFEAQSLPELSIRIHQGEYVPLEILVPELPATFVDIVRRAMHHDASQRFPSARALGEALDKLREGDELADTVLSPAPLAQPKRPLILVLAVVVTLAGLAIGYALFRAQKPVTARAPSSLVEAPSIAPLVSEPVSRLEAASASIAPSATSSPPGTPPRAVTTERRSVDKKLETGNPY